ncbi:TPA: hypothetical protein QHB97_000349 [Klebsiella quasipneumoniae subsp. similipneumoniae]|nr:hypothetical protein [Klebsiella quasipneumoniae subsp. similipneumoniae]
MTGVLDEIAPTQEGVHSNSVVDRWLSSASDADHNEKQVRFCLFFAQLGKGKHIGHFVVGLLSLLADKGCATLFNNDVAVGHRYLSPISLSGFSPYPDG